MHDSVYLVPDEAVKELFRKLLVGERVAYEYDKCPRTPRYENRP